MSEPEGFLRRWARRKSEAAHETEAAAAEPTAPPPEAEAPPIDLAALPSLDSITAETDIRAFLAPGVPAELTRAALRRAWAADPQIRDFIGLAENQWDFTAPEGLYGFGQLGVEEARRLAAAIFSEPAAARVQDPPVDPAPMPGKTALPTVSEESQAASLPGVATSMVNQDANEILVGRVERPAEGPVEVPILSGEKVGEAPDLTGKSMLRRTHGRALPE